MFLQKNIYILTESNIYETLSWPNKKNPKFLNVVLKVKTILSPIKLLKVCKEIEKTLGRKKNTKNAPRQCDIDIIDYNNKILIVLLKVILMPNLVCL